MVDTITAQKILTNTIDSGELDATVRSFPRTVSPSVNDAKRQSIHLGSLSPTVLRVAHTARSSTNKKQRSLMQIQQQLTRLDALSNPVSVTAFDIAIQTNIPADVTQAEWLEAFSLLIGALLAGDAALAKALYNGEL